MPEEAENVAETTETQTPEEVKPEAGAEAGGSISKDDAIKIAEAQGGSREEIETAEPPAVGTPAAEDVKPEAETAAVAEPEATETAETPATEESKPAAESLKINIIFQGDRVFLGAQAQNCDPKMATFQGTLQTALERIPGFVEECRQQWSVTPHNPKAAVPEPPPAATASRSASASAAKAAPPAQPNFF